MVRFDPAFKRFDRAIVRAGRAVGLREDRAGLVRLGLALLAVYVLFAWLHPGRADRATRHAVEWVATALWLALFGYGLRPVRALDARGTPPWRVLVAFAVLFAAAAAAIPPFQSTDVQAYVGVGRLQAHYGLNPYVHVPADVPDWQADGAFAGQWAETPCTYGFLFALLCRGLSALGGEDPGLTLLLFKLVGIATLAGVTWLVQDTLRRAGRGASALPVYLLLWNPYVLLHFVSNAHNDLLLALCLVLALRHALRGGWVGVMPALAAGVLVKHVAAVVVPFAFVFLVRRHGWRRGLGGTLAAVPLLVLAALPYVSEWSSFRWDRILALLTSSWNSFQAVFRHVAGWLGRLDPALGPLESHVETAARLAFGAGFLVFYGWRLGIALRRPAADAADLVRDGLLALFVLLCVASSAWHPWYLGMFLPAVFLLPEGNGIRRLTVWLTGFQMLYFAGVGKARVLEALLTLALPMVLFWRTRRGAGATSRDPT